MRKIKFLAVFGVVIFASNLYADVWLGTFGDNDKIDNVQAEINNWFNTHRPLLTAPIVSLFDKTDEKPDYFTISGGTKSGTWNSTSPINFYTVKAGSGNQPNTGWALYWLESGPEISGTWSTIHVSDKDVSHMSAFTTNAVPVPGAVLLGSIGLAAAQFKMRRRKNA